MKYVQVDHVIAPKVDILPPTPTVDPVVDTKTVVVQPGDDVFAGNRGDDAAGDDDEDDLTLDDDDALGGDDDDEDIFAEEGDDGR